MALSRGEIYVKLKRFQDLVENFFDRADKIWYYCDGDYIVVVASNAYWEGSLDEIRRDQKLFRRWEEARKTKGVEADEFLDAFEFRDRLKSVSRGARRTTRS